MDARETALIDACTLAGIEIYDEEAEGVVKLLREGGFDLIHRDENHGPTLERAAGVADKRANDCFASFDQTAKPYWDGAVESAERIASALRAMEVKHHG
jgi:hypothetical protein